MLIVTKEDLIKFDRSIANVPNLQALAIAINQTTFRYNIATTPRRLRYFIAQVAYETGMFNHFVEDLNYSAARLVGVWPSRFTLDFHDKKKAYAPYYARNPEKLGNFVYANRLGNRFELSGDGYLYRGRGGMHLTGRANYQAASTALFGDLRLLDNPDLVSEKETYECAMLTAGWFWDNNNLNLLADRDEFTKATGIINGSTSTAQSRLIYLRKANQTIGHLHVD